MMSEITDIDFITDFLSVILAENRWLVRYFQVFFTQEICDNHVFYLNLMRTTDTTEFDLKEYIGVIRKLCYNRKYIRDQLFDLAQRYNKNELVHFYQCNECTTTLDIIRVLIHIIKNRTDLYYDDSSYTICQYAKDIFCIEETMSTSSIFTYKISCTKYNLLCNYINSHV